MEIGENRFRPGPAKADYQAGFVLRFNLTRRLHLQSELNFAFVNYSIRAEGSRARSVSLRSERFEIPLLLGLQFGPLRLFGGAQFRVADSERDSAPKLLKVNFNDDVGIMGGVMLALGRALGETMAVTFIIGNTYQLDSASLYMPGNSITSALANEFAEAETGLHVAALMELGLILFVITFIVLAASKFMIMRLAKNEGAR